MISSKIGALKKVKIIDKSRGLIFFRVNNRFFRLEDNSYFKHYSIKSGWTLMELVSTDYYEEENLTERDVLMHNYDAMMMDIYRTKKDCLMYFESVDLN